MALLFQEKRLVLWVNTSTVPTDNKLSLEVDGFAVSGKKVGFVSQYYNGAYVTHNINKLNVEEVDSFTVGQYKYCAYP